MILAKPILIIFALTILSGITMIILSKKKRKGKK